MHCLKNFVPLLLEKNETKLEDVWGTYFIGKVLVYKCCVQIYSAKKDF